MRAISISEMFCRVGENMAVAMLISWLGALAFCACVVAFMIALMLPKNTVPPEDATKIRKLVWKEDE